MNKPNVILLTIDTLRADMLGCYGYNVSLTPHIDQLAASGIRFEQAITGGSWTQAAFPVLLTSSYASMYGGCLGPLAYERPSPVDALAAHGYTTAGFSTNPLLSRGYGYQRGFHHFVDLIPQEQESPLRRIKGGEYFLRKSLTHYLSKLLGKRTRPARLYVSAADLTENVCQWLHGAQAPFFAWIHYMDVHWPYHREETLVRPRDIAQAWKDLAHLHRVSWQGATITSAQRAHYMQLYEQAVQYTDSHIGRLLDELDRLGHLTNTVVVLVSDHGEEFLEHGRWGHFENNLYDEILHVPLIMHVPSSTTGQVVKCQVRTLDIMPTILDLCGCSWPNGLEGTTLASCWTQAAAEYEATLSISEMWREGWHIIAVRTEASKYIWDSRQPDQPQLFDLQADPGERQNVCQHYPEQARQFQSHVEAHLHRRVQTAPATAGAEPELDEEIVRRLRDLGYVE